MAITRPTTPNGVTAELPLRSSTGGTSGSFLVAADDKRRYWCKPLNNLQSPRVSINEQIVARLGQLIQAPVCDPQFVLLDGIVGWEFRPGHHVEAGWAHGCLAVEPSHETHDLTDRSSDDNSKRHAGMFAVHDWLGGSDPQWLVKTDADNAYYSHDHGHYLAGPNWTEHDLANRTNDTFALGNDPAGLDQAEVHRLASAIEQVSREQVEAKLSMIPAGWPVGDGELDAVCSFVYDRRTAVAGRLRGLLP